MLKDILRRKEIMAKSAEIADEIMKRYSPEMDAGRPGESKAVLKKKRAKLSKALKFGRTSIRSTASDMGLGIYGKAKLCKTIQDIMISKGYSEGATKLIVEELAVTV